MSTHMDALQEISSLPQSTDFTVSVNPEFTDKTSMIDFWTNETYSQQSSSAVSGLQPTNTFQSSMVNIASGWQEVISAGISGNRPTSTFIPQRSPSATPGVNRTPLATPDIVVPGTPGIYPTLPIEFPTSSRIPDAFIEPSAIMPDISSTSMTPSDMKTMFEKSIPESSFSPDSYLNPPNLTARSSEPTDILSKALFQIIPMAIPGSSTQEEMSAMLLDSSPTLPEIPLTTIEECIPSETSNMEFTGFSDDSPNLGGNFTGFSFDSLENTEMPVVQPELLTVAPDSSMPEIPTTLET
ncbi:hypothetical protein O0L34_g13470 [Tuta absoluta]|nr:hypothetical protein O0L34_g13470 [Tuta absoluta]